MGQEVKSAAVRNYSRTMKKSLKQSSEVLFNILRSSDFLLKLRKRFEDY
jgi:hypothetical protein